MAQNTPPQKTIDIINKEIEEIFHLANSGLLEGLQPADILFEAPLYDAYLGIIKEANYSNTEARGNSVPKEALKEWDIFICHANEDKEAIADNLADGLRGKGLKVWYDDFILTMGDSLKQMIDEGLTKSRFGVVILSPNFFNKNWPQEELDGLAARAMSENRKVILPVWHKINKEQIIAKSPSLAGKIGALSSKGVHHVISEIMSALSKEGVTLSSPVGKESKSDDELPGKYIDILVFISKGKTDPNQGWRGVYRTDIEKQFNMSEERARDYLDFLMGEKIICFSKRRLRVTYQLTTKGRRYLSDIELLE